MATTSASGSSTTRVSRPTATTRATARRVTSVSGQHPVMTASRASAPWVQRSSSGWPPADNRSLATRGGAGKPAPPSSLSSTSLRHDQRVDTNRRPITIVTGGGRGIGAATALHLARSGHDVVVNYRRNHEAAEGVVREAEAAGARAVAVQADVTREDEVERLFATA